MVTFIPADDIFPIEFSSANVTCVARSTSSLEKIPDQINITRRLFTDPGDPDVYAEVTPDENLYFTNRTDIQGIFRLIYNNG